MINHSSTLKATLFAPPNQGVRDLCRSPALRRTYAAGTCSIAFCCSSTVFTVRAADRPRDEQAEVSLLRDRGWERPFSTKKYHFSTPKPPPLEPPSAAKSNGHLSVPDNRQPPRSHPCRPTQWPPSRAALSPASTSCHFPPLAIPPRGFFAQSPRRQLKSAKTRFTAPMSTEQTPRL